MYLNDWCPSDISYFSGQGLRKKCPLLLACFPSRNIRAEIIPLTGKFILKHIYAASPNSGRVTSHFEIPCRVGA